MFHSVFMMAQYLVLIFSHIYIVSRQQVHGREVKTFNGGLKVETPDKRPFIREEKAFHYLVYISNN